MERVIIIGGGQSGLATAYFLRRHEIPFRILDDQEAPGGAWLHTWHSLHLFSPSSANSLPGKPMPPSEGEYPTRDEMIRYLQEYEDRYEVPIDRPVRVKDVSKEQDLFRVTTNKEEYFCEYLVAATGTWDHPFIPEIPGRDSFKGEQLHSAHYKEPERFRGKKVAVVGGGNSGAQILAEVSKVADTVWVTREEPGFLPDDVDGRYLFLEATKRYQAKRTGAKPDQSVFDLGSIVMVPEVKEARERGVLHSIRMFEAMDEEGVRWSDGSRTTFDAIIWCTGFKPALGPLRSLGIQDENGRVAIEKNRSTKVDKLYFVGYGSWTGFASATIIGVGRTAKRVAQNILNRIDRGPSSLSHQ